MTIDRRRRRYRNQVRDRFGVRLSSHTIGAIGEMVVISDLLKQGWEVYRSMSPHARADLIVRRHARTLMIEVRSGTQNLNGRICWATPARPKAWDIVAVVLPDNSIHYVPPLPGRKRLAQWLAGK